MSKLVRTSLLVLSKRIESQNRCHRIPTSPLVARKQPCTESPDKRHTGKLRSKGVRTNAIMPQFCKNEPNIKNNAIKNANVPFFANQ
ncbi:hypothetical protein T4B_10562 [Trichinella pseudospiralis]|uniref:Uncharacterized protein n=1 Tax=Trichinella pseudospiralis TaxID=6337 RepID=A0A0V1J3Z9_TRIPS|nr:hypothetical protein T4B_10562 [Trichinella pseudospiralis]